MKNEETSKLRETLLVIVIGFTVLHVVFDQTWMLYLALGIGILGTSSVKLNKFIHTGWFWLAHKLGAVVGKIILGTLYFVLLLPLGLLSQLIRKDLMHLRSHRRYGYNNREHQYVPEDFENMW